MPLLCSCVVCTFFLSCRITAERPHKLHSISSDPFYSHRHGRCTVRVSCLVSVDIE